MKYSLLSREIIADSIEAVVGCQAYDGVIAIGAVTKYAGLHHGLGTFKPSRSVYLWWHHQAG